MEGIDFSFNIKGITEDGRYLITDNDFLIYAGKASVFNNPITINGEEFRLPVMKKVSEIKKDNKRS